MKEVFPKEIEEHSALIYFLRFSAANRTFYYLLITAIVTAIMSLPVIEVDIYQNARGIIKPIRERQVISTLNSGRVIFSRLLYNLKVRQGDTLLIIGNNGLDEELLACRSRLNDLQLQLRDLELLLSSTPVGGALALQSNRYRNAYYEFQLKEEEFKMRIAHHRKELDRTIHLFKRGVISAAEYEQYSLDQGLILSERKVLRQSQQALWHSDRARLTEALEDLIAEEKKLSMVLGQHVITANINGILINVQPQHESSLVSAGTRLAEISPDTTLVAECYIPPRDIGLIKVSHEVSFKLDSYDYNQWGIIKGSIVELGRDMEIVDGKPVFKVRCLLENDFLELNSGFRGKINKGMTLTAQFQIAKKSLWQLLYGKTDQWINPGQTRDDYLRT